MTPNVTASWGLALLFGLAMCGVLLRHARHGGAIIYLGCAAACAVLTSAAVNALFATSSVSLLALPVGLPLGHTLLGFDALSAVFSIIVNGVAAIVSVYAIGYGAHETQPTTRAAFLSRLSGRHELGVISERCVLVLGWLGIHVAQFVGIGGQQRSRCQQSTGRLHLFGDGTMRHLGVCLLAFGLLAGNSGGYSFADMRHALPSARISIAVLLLGLAGAGSKAGLFPLHGWLPLAHPAAPSHVSALMSGVMTKVAIYGFMRLAFDLAAVGDAGRWLGAVLVGLGAITAVYGVLAALFETDIKRVLAYSTIENIGIIFGALGLALALRADDYSLIAAVALSAALLHAANHALFQKPVVHGRGRRREGNRRTQSRCLGWTGSAHAVDHDHVPDRCRRNFRIAAVQWIRLGVVAVSSGAGHRSRSRLVAQNVSARSGRRLCAGGCLGGRVFIRLFGITFLGRARSTGAATAHETDRYSIAAMCLVAAGCVLLGALPVLAIEPLQRAVLLCISARLPDQTTLPWLSLAPLSASGSSYNGLTIMMFLLISAVLAALALRFAASGALRRGATWDCGTPDARPITQYSAESFAQPLKRVFGTTLFAASERAVMPKPGDTQPARAEVQWRDLPWELLYLPIGRSVLWIAGKANALQFLTISRYLLLCSAHSSPC